LKLWKSAAANSVAMIEAFRAATRIYLDTNIVIYLFERDDALQKKIAAIISQTTENDIEFYFSDVGVAECIYGAYKIQSDLLLQKYNESFYEVGLLNLVPVDSECVIAAAKIGAEKNLKLVDSIHFLAAIETGCEVFLTNDYRFKSSHGVKVLQLNEI
jgi:predicted nucleic acid-binding protein